MRQMREDGKYHLHLQLRDQTQRTEVIRRRIQEKNLIIQTNLFEQELLQWPN